MTGLSVLLRKEALESWRTLRLPIVMVLFAIVGLLSPVLARYLPEILEAAAGDQLGTIVLPPPVAADAADQLARNLGQFGALTAVLLAMGSVATEKERGTAAFVVVKPVSRVAFLVAKLVVLLGILALGSVLSVVLAAAYTAVLFEPLPIGGWAGFASAAFVALVAFASITFAASVVARSAAVAAGIGLVAFLVLSIAAALPVIGPLTPTGLLQAATSFAAGAESSLDDLLKAIAAITAVSVAALGLAIWSFKRQEL